MGVEVKDAIITAESYERNFTNEGGVEGTTRFLKNICGMWLLERCRKEWERDGNYSYSELIDAALAVPAFRSVINPDAACFANPVSMVDAIRGYCSRTGQPVPETYGELTRCIFDSLALRYRQVFGYMQSMAPFPIERLHVIGGGAQNDLLNRMTADAVGIPVVAQQPAEPVHLQRRGCTRDGRTVRRHCARQHHAPGEGLRSGGHDAGDARHDSFLHRAGRVRTEGCCRVGCRLREVRPADG